MDGVALLAFCLFGYVPIMFKFCFGIPVRRTLRMYADAVQTLFLVAKWVATVLLGTAVSLLLPVENPSVLDPIGTIRRNQQIRAAYPIHQDYRSSIVRSAKRACLRRVLGRPRPYYYRVSSHQIRSAERKLGMNQGWKP